MAGPFDSRTKLQVTVVRYNGSDYVRVFAKGAPEFLIQSCSKYFNAEGNVQPLN